MSGLASRALVAAALLPLTLGAVYAGGWWLFALALLGGLVALHELYVMARQHRPVALGGFVGLTLTLLGSQLGGLEWAFGGLLATLLVSFVLFLVSDTRPSATAAMGATVLGVVWVGGGLVATMELRAIPEWGKTAVFTTLLAVFAADTFAYFVGRAIGRHRMAPTISPGKSWEGFAGGFVAAVAVAFFALYRDRDEFLTVPEALVLGAVVAVSSVIGDLFESAVKRDLGVKDSGRLLAGHGGVLDRIDSIVFAGPAAYFTVAAFGFS